MLSCQGEVSDSVTDFSVLSNIADAQNVSSLEYWAGYFQPSVLSIYIKKKLRP